MAGLFTAGDIVQAAIQVETKGESFYKRVASKAANTQVRDLFLYLAGEEVKHRETFQELQTRVGQAELPAWSTEQEYQEYLESLIESHILFGDGLGDTILSHMQQESEALRFAMGFEKDTILFFMEMRELVPESEKPYVQACIEEEREHLRKLRSMLKSL